MLSSFLIALVAVVATAALGRTGLLAVTVICWTQNLLLPWWYTEGWLAADVARSLILLKEVMLAALVGMLVWELRWYRIGTAPAPVRLAIASIAYILVRVALGLVILGEPLLAQLRLVRSFLLPGTLVLVGFGFGVLSPDTRDRYARAATLALGICAVVSLYLFFGVPDTFWSRHVNIAAYNVDVKGDAEWTVDLEAGVSGTGVGRALFVWLSSFRLIGTFGDPLTAGFVLGTGVLLLAAHPRPRLAELAALAACATGLLLTFSRSAWIFTALGLAYLAVRQRWILRTLVAGALAAGVWIYVGTDLLAFFADSVAAFDLESGDVYHAEGLMRFWSGELFNATNLLGQGPLRATEQTATVESGFAYMIEQFGLPAFAIFVALCLSLERYLRRSAAPDDHLSQVAAATALGTLVTSNFSFYALSFTPYFAIWILMGLSLGVVHRATLGRLVTTPTVRWPGVLPAERPA